MLEEMPEEVLIRAKKLNDNLFFYGLVMPNGEEMEFVSEPVGYIKLGDIPIDLNHVNSDTVFIVNLKELQQAQHPLEVNNNPELQSNYEDMEGEVEVEKNESELDIRDKLVLDKFVDALIANRQFQVNLESQGSNGKEDRKLSLFMDKVQQYLLDHWVDISQIQVREYKQVKALKNQGKSLVALKISNE